MSHVTPILCTVQTCLDDARKLLDQFARAVDNEHWTEAGFAWGSLVQCCVSVDRLSPHMRDALFAEANSPKMLDYPNIPMPQSG